MFLVNFSYFRITKCAFDCVLLLFPTHFDSLKYLWFASVFLFSLENNINIKTRFYFWCTMSTIRLYECWKVNKQTIRWKLRQTSSKSSCLFFANGCLGLINYMNQECTKNCKHPFSYLRLRVILVYSSCRANKKRILYDAH